MFFKYKTPRRSENLDKYQGELYAAIVKYGQRYVMAGGYDNETELKFKLAEIKESQGKIIQTYNKFNDLALEILDFAATQMNRGTKFKKLEELLR